MENKAQAQEISREESQEERIQIINYLPAFIANYDEIKKIMQCNQLELNSLWEAHSWLLFNNFVDSANSKGIERLEKILKITRKTNEALADRKFAVLLAMNRELPYTIRKLRASLTSILGNEEAYNLEVKADNYAIFISIKSEYQGKLLEIIALLRETAPANMIVHSSVSISSGATVKVGTYHSYATHVIVSPYQAPTIETVITIKTGANIKYANTVKITALSGIFPPP